MVDFFAGKKRWLILLALVAFTAVSVLKFVVATTTTATTALRKRGVEDGGSHSEKKKLLRTLIWEKFQVLQRQQEQTRQLELMEIQALKLELAKMTSLERNLTTTTTTPKSSLTSSASTLPAPVSISVSMGARSNPCKEGTSNATRWNKASPSDRLKYHRRNVLQTPTTATTTTTAAECQALNAAFQVEYPCNTMERFGGNSAGAGGYNVCRDFPFPAPTTACVSYSFGIAQDWSYDVDMSGQCYTYSWDPTLFKKKNVVLRYEGRQINFYKWGLTSDGRSFCHRGVTEVWSKTLAGCMAYLGHSHVDILKLSIDDGEWEFLLSQNAKSSQNSSLHHVTQLVMLLHFQFVEIPTVLQALSALREFGFKLFYTTYNRSLSPQATTTSVVGSEGEVSEMCGNSVTVEVGFVNSRWFVTSSPQVSTPAVT